MKRVIDQPQNQGQQTQIRPPKKRLTKQSSKTDIRQQPTRQILGEGGFLRVYRSIENPDICVAQFINSDKINHDMLLKLVMREEILNRIDSSRRIFGGRILEPREYFTGQTQISSYTMSYEGISLNKFSIPNYADRWNTLSVSFLNLIYGIILLSRNGFIHGDIKLPNIVFNETEKTLKYIDYSLMNIEEGVLDEEISTHSKKLIYNVWPPELWFLYRTSENQFNSQGYIYILLLILDLYKFGIVHKQPDCKETLKDLKEKSLTTTGLTYNKNPSFIHTLGDIFLGEIKILILLLLNDSSPSMIRLYKEHSSHNSWLYELLCSIELYRNSYRRSETVMDLRKIDIYGLGMAGFNLFGLYSKANHILTRMIHPNYNERIDPVEAYTEWYNLLLEDEKDVSSYLSPSDVTSS
jgi:serine/threonine protein kinase